METILNELIKVLKDLTQKISLQYSSLNTNFSGIENKLSDYSIFTLVKPKMINHKIELTFPRANYITAIISDSTAKINIGVNSAGKQKLPYKDGSYFKGVISDIYIDYDFTELEAQPTASIYIGYNSEYLPITTVKINDLDVNNAVPVNVISGDITIDSNPKTYSLNVSNGNLNNQIQNFTLSSPTNSIMIKNTGDNDLYFGNISDINDLSQAIKILAGETLEIPFNPICNNYTYSLASLLETSYTIAYNTVTL